MIWDYLGHQIDEGMKPRDENFNDDYYQYFFIVKRDNEKKFKFCIWAKIDMLESDPSMAEETRETGHKIPESIYRTAHARVMEKIEKEDFENCLLEYDENGLNELRLDEMNEKKV